MVLGGVTIVIYKKIKNRRVEQEIIEINLDLNQNMNLNNQSHNAPLYNSVEIYLLLTALIWITFILMICRHLNMDDFGKDKVILIFELSTEYIYGLIIPITSYIRNKKMRIYVWREFKDILGSLNVLKITIFRQ